VTAVTAAAACNVTYVNGSCAEAADGIDAAAEVEPSFIFEFLVPAVLVNGVGVLGLVGNLLSIFILSRPQMKGSTNCILIGLATYDSILIISSILMFGLPAVFNYSKTLFSFYYWEIFPFITPFVYPIGLIAQTTSAYLTLCVTVERYVAVCQPLKARSLCTYGRARSCVVIMGTAALIYNIPRFFEVTWKNAYNEQEQLNRTQVIPTKLRQNETYISVYITWMYLVVMYIVPFTCLALFNLRIYIQIRRANMERAKLSRLQQREIGMATMLICVVMVFFACNVLALVVNVLELLAIEITALTHVSNLLVTLNSSVNFIIYCIYGDKFRRLFCYIFCKRCNAGAAAAGRMGTAVSEAGGGFAGGAGGTHHRTISSYPTTTTVTSATVRGGGGGGGGHNSSSSSRGRVHNNGVAAAATVSHHPQPGHRPSSSIKTGNVSGSCISMETLQTSSKETMFRNVDEFSSIKSMTNNDDVGATTGKSCKSVGFKPGLTSSSSKSSSHDHPDQPAKAQNPRKNVQWHGSEYSQQMNGKLPDSRNLLPENEEATAPPSKLLPDVVVIDSKVQPDVSGESAATVEKSSSTVIVGRSEAAAALAEANALPDEESPALVHRKIMPPENVGEDSKFPPKGSKINHNSTNRNKSLSSCSRSSKRQLAPNDESHVNHTSTSLKSSGSEHTATAEELQLTADIDRELNAIIKITLSAGNGGGSRGNSSSIKAYVTSTNYASDVIMDDSRAGDSDEPVSGISGSSCLMEVENDHDDDDDDDEGRAAITKKAVRNCSSSKTRNALLNRNHDETVLASASVLLAATTTRKTRHKKCREKGAAANYYFHQLQCNQESEVNDGIHVLKSNSMPRSSKERRNRRRINLIKQCSHHHHHHHHHCHAHGGHAPSHHQSPSRIAAAAGQISSDLDTSQRKSAAATKSSCSGNYRMCVPHHTPTSPHLQGRCGNIAFAKETPPLPISKNNSRKELVAALKTPQPLSAALNPSLNRGSDQEKDNCGGGEVISNVNHTYL